MRKRAKNFSEKYDRGKLLGKNAFGQVYKCWIKGTDGKKTTQALKVLKKALLSQKPDCDDLLVNEFRIIMEAKHPNIIRMYDIF